MDKQEIDKLNQEFSYLTPQDLIQFFLQKYKNRIALASNLGAEDQILTQMVSSLDQTAIIFTLDTHKLFNESYRVIEKTNKKYNIQIKLIAPEQKDIDNAFEGRPFTSIYDSIENRKKCCNARKVIPLKKFLGTVDAWITGLRKEQSVTRTNMQLIEWDEEFNILKINPLINWTEKQVWQYIKDYDVPYNELHDKGYPSIGCQPCTRAVEPGEDVRAGRWWWENPEYRECGLHKK